MDRQQKPARLFILLIAVLLAAQLACSFLQSSSPAAVTVPEVDAVPQASLAAPAQPSETPSVVPFTATPTAAADEIPYGGPARAYLDAIVGEIGPRLTGSKADKDAANYIEKILAEMGYQVERQPFTITDEDGNDLQSANIMAVKKGASDREIVVGAHYDSADDGNGADDNASGVAVMLEAAGRIKDLQTPYTVRFIAFGAEETGLNGSAYYVNHLGPAGIEKTVYMVNMDSLIAGEIAYVYGDVDISGNLRDWMLKDASRNDFHLEGKTAQELDPPGNPCECSDYFAFKKAKIPYVYFEATNWNLGEQDGWTQVNPDLGDDGMIWHTKFDRIEYIEEIAPGRIDRHLEVYAALLVDALTKFEFK
jgi:hypothetical protein